MRRLEIVSGNGDSGMSWVCGLGRHLVRGKARVSVRRLRWTLELSVEVIRVNACAQSAAKSIRRRRLEIRGGEEGQGRRHLGRGRSEGRRVSLLRS